MNKKPVAIGLLACDQVIVEEKTRNVTPVNCFTHRAARDFPTEAISFSVLAFLADGLGEIDLEVVLQDLDNMDVLHRVGGRVNFHEPLVEYRCVFRVRELSFPQEGAYEVLPSCRQRTRGSSEDRHSPQARNMNNNHYDGFDSRNSTIVFIDGPGDNTVRPCPPHLRPILEEIKRKEQEYKKLMQENAKPKELDENL